MKKNRISIGSDHGGYLLKEELKKYLSGLGYEVVDCGTDSKDISVDYPDYAKKACQQLQQEKVDYAIVVCTTGIGVSIVANKMKGIRAALVTNLEQAKLTRMHNDANCLALGAINQSLELAKEIAKTFIETPFSFEERHQRRVNKIKEIEG